jgi:hypothetical protein
MKYDIKINFTPSILLTILFIILKINEIINWNWIWIFSPLWIFGILVSIILGILWIKYKKKYIKSER